MSDLRFTSESLRGLDTRDLHEIEPASIEEAQLLRSEINRRVLLIDMQLKSPDRRDTDGNRLSGDDYWEWRRTAVGAQSFARQRMGQLRDWIKANNRPGDQPGAHNYGDLLYRIANALESIAASLEKKP